MLQQRLGQHPALGSVQSSGLPVSTCTADSRFSKKIPKNPRIEGHAKARVGFRWQRVPFATKDCSDPQRQSAEVGLAARWRRLMSQRQQQITTTCAVNPLGSRDGLYGSLSRSLRSFSSPTFLGVSMYLGPTVQLWPSMMTGGVSI